MPLSLLLFLFVFFENVVIFQKNVIYGIGDKFVIVIFSSSYVYFLKVLNFNF